MLTKHLIHHILVRGPRLNSGRLQCHALRQEGLQKAEVIGLEYGIECQTTKDIHLSHGRSALLLLAGIYLVIHSTLPSSARTEEQERATGTGSVWWSPMRASGVTAPVQPVRGCVNHGSPKAQGSFV